MGYVTWQCPFQGHFVIRRQGLAMFSQHIKFEMSTITCNKEMKGNAKCKILVLSHPKGWLRTKIFTFRDLGVTHMVHLWLGGKRVIDFLLGIIELFRWLSRLGHY